MPFKVLIANRGEIACKIINSAKKIFEKFNVCLASNKESEDFLKMLGAKNIKNYGNLKFSNSCI